MRQIMNFHLEKLALLSDLIGWEHPNLLSHQEKVINGAYNGTVYSKGYFVPAQEQKTHDQLPS